MILQEDTDYRQKDKISMNSAFCNLFFKLTLQLKLKHYYRSKVWDL